MLGTSPGKKTAGARQGQTLPRAGLLCASRTPLNTAPAGTTLQYLLTCDVLGAPMGLALLSADSPITFQPVLFKLDTSTIGVTGGGTFDLSKKAVA